VFAFSACCRSSVIRDSMDRFSLARNDPRNQPNQPFKKIEFVTVAERISGLLDFGAAISSRNATSVRSSFNFTRNCFGNPFIENRGHHIFRMQL